MSRRAPLNDPFNDPFFRDPFSMMGNMMGNMNSMLGNMNGMMGGMLNDPFFGGNAYLGGPAAVQDRGRYGTRDPGYDSRVTAPMIEEVDDYAPSETVSHPIVEEPDDDSPPRRLRTRHDLDHPAPESMSRSVASYGSGQAAPATRGAGPAAASYGFYYSSSHMSNHNGVTYQKSTTGRMGPGGVKEYQSTVRDGRSGNESITVSRALGDKSRTTTRTRDATGQETVQDVLRGLQQDEASRFCNEWQQSAQQSLFPMGQSSRQAQPGLLGAGPLQPPGHYALPSTSRPARDVGSQLQGSDARYQPQDSFAGSQRRGTGGTGAMNFGSHTYDDSRPRY